MIQNFLIRLCDVSKIYRGRRRKRNIGLLDISLDFPKRGMVFVCGKSGAGKTTLLNLISGLDKPSKGKILYQGKDMNSFSFRDTLNFRRNGIGFIMQTNSLIPNYSVIENIKVALRLIGVNKTDQDSLALEALRRVGLEEKAQERVGSISGGEYARIQIARALAKKPRILLCDEPTGNLDEENSLLLFDYLKEISESRLVIIATHDQHLVQKYADRIISIENHFLTRDDDLCKTDHIDEDQEQDQTQARMKQGRINLEDLISISWMFIKNHLFSLAVMIILIACLSTLMASMLAIVEYDRFSAYMNTLEEKDEYVIPVTKYEDQADYFDNQIIFYGPSTLNNEIDESHFQELSAIVNGRLPILRGYYFSWNFQDFMDFRFVINPDFSQNPFYATNFSTLIVVEDFSEFHEPIRYGEYPDEPNEVLIYDYMAYNILESGGLTEIATQSDLIDFELVDKDTGLKMTISGILRSDYRQYLYVIYQQFLDARYEATYLSGLRAIYGFADILEEVSQRENMYSLNNISFYDEKDYQFNFITTDCQFRKLRIVTSLEGYDTIGDVKNVGTGLIMSDHQLAKVMDIEVSDIDADLVNNLSLYGGIRDITQTYTNSSMRINPLLSALYAVYRSDSYDPYIMDFMYDPGLVVAIKIPGSLRMHYLGLSNDWSKNRDVLDELQWPQNPLSVYENDSNYHVEGYAEYTVYRDMIVQATDTVESIQRIGTRIGIIVGATTVFFLILFVNNARRKNRFNLGVLSSIGASGFQLAIFVGSELVIVGLLGTACGIAPAIYLTNLINRDLFESLPLEIFFFEVSWSDYLFVALVQVLLLTTSAVVVYGIIPRYQSISMLR
ncbi:MAG: ABC transporter ATP-binding protein/permease [Sphaerochaeta sp.]|jgi:ABC-type lipoprotein export system ATPase subunit/ABC-type antimicrobial peptide transport system permease subunit|nr:ABC transporter ATP-binding protein/permease [Sphaerochaeta sp.]